jgi:hypothetical protein
MVWVFNENTWSTLEMLGARIIGNLILGVERRPKLFLSHTQWQEMNVWIFGLGGTVRKIHITRKQHTPKQPECLVPGTVCWEKCPGQPPPHEQRGWMLQVNKWARSSWSVKPQSLGGQGGKNGTGRRCVPNTQRSYLTEESSETICMILEKEITIWKCMNNGLIIWEMTGEYIFFSWQYAPCSSSAFYWHSKTD